MGVMSNGTAASSSPLAAAVCTDTLGVGFSGSGFLIFYFTGVTAVLKQLGIITNKTRVAGASGGSANAVLTCADVPLQQQYDNLYLMATACRPTTPACQGFLDQQVNKSLATSVPANAPQLCSNRLWVSVTAAKPEGQPDTNLLLGPKWSSQQELVAAVRLSAFIPGVSGLSATKQLPELPAVGAAYDGGFTQNLPCPPGVKFCVKVAAIPYNPSVPAEAGIEAAVREFNKLATSPQAQPALGKDPATAPFLPLNPVIIRAPKPDIWPGLAQPLPVNGTVWSSWGLAIPDNATIQKIFDIGRQDAAFWATQQGLVNAAAATNALSATMLKQ